MNTVNYVGEVSNLLNYDGKIMNYFQGFGVGCFIVWFTCTYVLKFGWI